MHTQKCPKTCNFALKCKLENNQSTNQNAKVIKLGAYIDSKVLKEYPNLKTNHTPQRNLDQKTKKPSKQRVSHFSSLHRARYKEGLALSASGKGEGFSTYSEVSLYGCAKGARV